VRPWQHVLEPLAGYLLLASRLWIDGAEFDGAWNFGPSEQGTVRVREVVDAIVAAWGEGSWESPADAAPQLHEARLLALEISKARTLLNWEPVYAIGETLVATGAWYADRHRGSDPMQLVTADIENYVAKARRAESVWTGSGAAHL